MDRMLLKIALRCLRKGGDIFTLNNKKGKHWLSVVGILLFTPVLIKYFHLALTDKIIGILKSEYERNQVGVWCL